MLGVLLLIAGGAYLASSFTLLIVPQYAPAVTKVTSLLEILELPIVFWLVIWGAKTRTPAPSPV